MGGDVRPASFGGRDAGRYPSARYSGPIFGLGSKGLIPALRYVSWFIVFTALMYVTGVLVASVVFILVFLLLEARWPLGRAVLLSVGVTLAVSLMIRGLGLRVPRTLLDIGHTLLQ